MNKAEVKKEKFDLTVNHRDGKTGLVTEIVPYTRRAISQGGGMVSVIYERPVGSGNVFWENNTPAGRYVKGKDGKGEFLKGAAHIEFKAPETAAELHNRVLNEKDAKIAQLEAELAGIAKESKKKQGS